MTAVEMLNKNPIFVVAFARGGSNILFNFLISHPDVCTPRGEIQQVFKGMGGEGLRTRLAKRLRYVPMMLLERSDIFAVDNWQARTPFTPTTQRRIDRILFHDKIKARAPGQNLFKTEGERYSKEEIARSRLLCKNLNGLIFLSREFHRMYPDAVFIALVRNGLAVCEGHMRRGYDLTKIAESYERACQQMIQDAQELPRYHLLRYEDIIDAPTASFHRIIELAGLDADKVPKVRMETKQVIDAGGEHVYVHGTDQKQVVWYDVDELATHLRTDANANQINRLTDEQRTTITGICRSSLEHFSYL